MQRAVKDLDIVIDARHPHFNRTGLRMESVVRVAQLTTLPDRVVQGSIGEVSPGTLSEIKERLRNWLR